MKFKDRLDLFNNSDDSVNENQDAVMIKDESDVSEIFVKDRTVEQLIKEAVLSMKNIIITSGIDCDNTILTQYVKQFFPKSDSCEIIYDVNKDLKYIKAKRVIIPAPDVKDIVKIFEYILYGYKSFIFSMNIKNYNNIIESLKTLILLYCPNLTDSGINNLIGQSDALIVHFDKNKDGLFMVNNIGQIKFKDNTLLLNTVYEILTDDNITNFIEKAILIENKEANTEDNPLEDEPSDETENVVPNKEEDKVEEAVLEIKEDVNSNEAEDNTQNEQPKKVNKYKLLKDKIKKKKDK